MIKLKDILLENVVKLTREDAQEVWHKFGVLSDNPDLQSDYGLTPEQTDQLVDSIPKLGGVWNIPEWGLNVVQGEMGDHITVLRDIAADAYAGGEIGQSLRIAKQAKRFVKMFGISDSLNEGTSIPGALEGWLDPGGKCYYVEDTHADLAARILKQPYPDTKDIGAYETQRIRLLRELYDKGWARIVIQHSNDLLYFDTYNTSWKTLSRSQRKWLYDAAIHGVKIVGDKIVIGDVMNFRHPAYHLRFGNKGGEWIKPYDILERKNMIKLKSILNESGSIVSSQIKDVICPFCKEKDFDLAGLKNHLEHGDCEIYNNLEYIPRLF